jgi:hypothetical protein
LTRIGLPKPPVSVLRPDFALWIVNAGGELHVFLESTVSFEILSRFYGIKEILL